MNKFSMSLVAIGWLACAGLNQAADSEFHQQATKLDIYTAWNIMWTREQAKVARDLDLNFYQSWDKPIFANMAKSEQRHMDAMVPLLERFELTDLVASDEIGAYGDERNTELYSELAGRGGTSFFAALRAVLKMEEINIQELRNHIYSLQEYGNDIASPDRQLLTQTYSNLLSGSYNHLRAYVAQVLDLGKHYVAQTLSQEEVDAILAEAIVPPQENFAINRGLTDSWYYPGANGQGFFISVYPDQDIIMLAWLTYDTELPGPNVVAHLGDPGQRWLTAYGGFAGAQAELQVYSSSGGLFDSGEPAPTHEPVGSILLQFGDCSHGTVTYDLSSIQRAGLIPIERISLDNLAVCKAYLRPTP